MFVCLCLCVCLVTECCSSVLHIHYATTVYKRRVIIVCDVCLCVYVDEMKHCVFTCESLH